RAASDHRHPRHDTRSGARWLPLLAIPGRSAGARGRAPPLPRHDLQGGDGASSARWRQIRHTRRSAANEIPGASAGIRRGGRPIGGRYIVAEDVGTSAEDMAIVRRMTRHVAGLPGAGGAGDPGPTTALGVLHGIRAAVRHKLGRRSLKGCSVAVQGLGSVGYRLCQLLHGEGACLTVADIDRSRVERAVKELSATPSEPEAIIEVESDVFAACALGAVLDDRTIPRLRAAIVAGSANNQL